MTKRKRIGLEIDQDVDFQLQLTKNTRVRFRKFGRILVGLEWGSPATEVPQAEVKQLEPPKEDPLKVSAEEVIPERLKASQGS